MDPSTQRRGVGIVRPMFEFTWDRLAGADLLVAVAVVTLVIPAVFLVLALAAGVWRFSGRHVGSRWNAGLAFTGGLSIGTLLLFGGTPVLAAPLILVPGWMVRNLLRTGRRRLAGWLLLGWGLPLLAGWVAATIAGAGIDPAEVLLEVVLWIGAGAALTVAGAWLLARGDPPLPAPDIAAPAGQPGSRDIGSIAAAIREPAMIGPFGLPELAMLAAFVLVWLLVPLLLPRDLDWPWRLGITSLAIAVVATEAYIRGMPPRMRRAFEAFSWLGEWEMARGNRVSGGAGIPLTPKDAESWLAQRAERLHRMEESLVRVEVLLLAGRIEEARGLVERVAERVTEPYERFEVAALRDLVDWRAGGDGDLAGAEAAAGELVPRDGDDRLRAEVTLAVARVRRLMADGRAGGVGAIEPLLRVRPLLGKRADGQVGRALRRRLIPVMLLTALVLGFIGEALAGTVTF